MKRSSAVIGISVAVLTISLWAFLNRPEEEPLWPQRIQGFSFSPMRADESPLTQHYPTEEEIDADLALLAGRTNAIRTYTVETVQGRIPALAKPHDINVAAGAWIDADLAKNEREIETLLKLSVASTNLVRLIVGNEVVLRGDIPVEQLTAYLDQVRRNTDIPVSTAEPWHVWIKHPELAAHVDYLAVHMLPYWEGVHLDAAVDYIVDRLADLKTRFPDKPIVIAEVGWPSNGRTREAAVASESNQATFLRRFLHRAEQENYVYYVMEAFDQPWKRDTEGAVGAYWGVYDVERQPKFPFEAPIVPIPNWYILAGLSVIIAAITLSVLLIDSHTLRQRGRGFLAIVAYGAATAAVWIVYDYIHQYLTVGTVLVGVLMFGGMVGVILVLLTEAHEWAEALWVSGSRRTPPPPAEGPAVDPPFVSIHVPAYNEPPEMLCQTLDALASMDYPAYEVLVIDNNTKDPAVWEPVARHCQDLGERFRFFHVDPLSGFKAGALNFALAQTSDMATIIGVIDSDYQVDPDWLKRLVPYFDRPTTALVQAPQDYRDGRQNLFKAMCFAEYRGFFYIGMLTRNERNAIIQHGTMTLVRRKVLEDVDGWSEWCITEDAELGLRIFEEGHEALYIADSFGKGLMPDTYQDYMKQRFRWAYGAIQILRRHAGILFGFRQSRLTLGQRYHFIAGWLPWIADGINLLFNAGAMAWSLAMIIAPRQVDPPLAELSLLPVTFFSFKAAKMLYLYQTRVRTSFLRTLAAGLAGLALSHTIAKAMFAGFFTRSLPFIRTPKWAASHALMRALGIVWQEALILAVLWGCAAGVYLRQTVSNMDLHLWIFVLLVQSLPYLSAVVVSFISAFPRLSAGFIGHPVASTDA
jgi:exo-beta-1,3-glucanase (GH17 family)/cellulose synthase/poly-beta-1,6-N-acetylglucosamine synthase-like glycosyltransferase